MVAIDEEAWNRIVEQAKIHRVVQLHTFGMHQESAVPAFTSTTQ
jgi:hypothetical protein